MRSDQLPTCFMHDCPLFILIKTGFFQLLLSSQGPVSRSVVMTRSLCSENKEMRLLAL